MQLHFGFYFFSAIIGIMKKRFLTFCKNNTFSLKAIFIVLGICFTLSISNYIYLQRCTEIFVGDQIGFLTDSISHFKHNTYIEFLSGTLRAPGLFILAGILYNFFPINEFTAISANIFFAFFLFSGTYFITYNLTKDKKASLDSLLILLFYPMTFGLSRFFIFEFALMSAVVIFVFFLLYSHSFKNKYFSCFLGASVGLGILSKESFFIFILGPLLWQLYLLISEKTSKKQYHHIFLCAFFALSLASIWFLRSPFVILADGFNRITLPANHSDITFFSLKNISFYFYSLADFSLSPFFMLLFFIGLKNLRHLKYKGLLLSWIIAPYIFFMFFPWKLARYIAPVLPAFAIITAVCLSHFSGKLKKILRIGYILFGILQFIVLTHFNVFNLKHHYFIETNVLSRIFQMQPSDYNATLWISQPNTTDSKTKAALETIDSLTQKNETVSVCRILNLPDNITPKKNTNEVIYADTIANPLATTLPLYNVSNNHNFDIAYCYTDSQNIWRRWPFSLNAEKVDRKDEFDFILAYNKKAVNSAAYRLIKTYTTSENHKLHLFANKAKENF